LGQPGANRLSIALKPRSRLIYLGTLNDPVKWSGFGERHISNQTQLLGVLALKADYSLQPVSDGQHHRITIFKNESWQWMNGNLGFAAKKVTPSQAKHLAVFSEAAFADAGPIQLFSISQSRKQS
jgi:hypothetical protein